MVQSIQVGSQTGVTASAGSTIFLYLGAGTWLYAHTTESNTQTVYRTAGTLTNLAIRITANASTGDTNTAISRKNAANGNLTFTIPTGAGSVGIYEDVTNSDSVAVADKLNISITAGTGGALTLSNAVTVFAASTNTVSHMLLDGGATYSTSATDFLQLAGYWSGANTTETYQKTRAMRAGTAKNLGFNAIANTGNNTATIKLRKAGADSGISAQAGANSGAGFFEDTANTTAVAIGDDLNYSFAHLLTSGVVSISDVWIELETTTNYAMLAGGITSGFAIAKNTTRFEAIGGILYASGGEAETQVKAYFAFTFSDLTFMVSAASGVTCTARFRKAGANGNQTCVSTANTPGRYTDTTHTDVVAATDLINLSFTTSSASGTNSTSITNYCLNTYFASAGQNITRALTTETVTVSDSGGGSGLARLTTKVRSVSSETVTVQESRARLANKTRAFTTETINVQESKARVKGKPRALTTETINTAESKARLAAKNRTLATETVTVTQSAFTRLTAKARSLTTEIINIAESIDRTVSHGVNNVVKTMSTEIVNVQESSARLASKLRILVTETVNTAESKTRLKASLRTMTTETVNVAESKATLRTKMRTLATETVNVAEGGLTRLTTKMRALTTETITLIESSLARQAAKIRRPDDLLYDDFNAATYNFTEGGSSPNGLWTNSFLSGGTSGTRFASSVNSNVMYQYPAVATAPEQTYSTVNLTTSTWENFELSVRVKTIQQLRQNSAPNNWERAWIFFRIIDNDHGYYFAMKNSGCEIGREDQGIEQIYLATPAESFPVGYWNTVRIRCTSDKVNDRVLIKVWVDNQLVADISDDAQLTVTPPSSNMFAAGKIGVYNEDAEVEFDDLRVMSIPTIAISEPSPPTLLKGKMRSLATETVTFTEVSLSRLTQKFRAFSTETVNVAEAVDRLKGHIGQSIEKVLTTETLNISESTPAKLLQKVRTLAAETLDVGEVGKARLSEKLRALTTETVTITEALDRLVTMGEIEVLYFSDSVTRTVTRANAITRSLATETLTITETSLTRLKGIVKTHTTETLSIAEASARLSSKFRALVTESLNLQESKARIKGKVRTLTTETVAVVEGLARQTAKIRNLTTETITTVEVSLARLNHKLRLLTTETVNVAEAVASLKGHAGQLVTRALTTETVNLAESKTRVSNKIRALTTETMNVGEQSIARLSAKIRTLTTETLAVNEAVAQTKNTARQIIKTMTTETVNLEESTARLTHKFRIMTTESVTIAEQAIFRSVGNARALTTETINLAQISLTRRITKGRVLATETLTITESALSRLAKKIRALTAETITITQSVPLQVRARQVIKTMTTETVNFVQQSLVRRTAKVRTLLTHILTIIEAEIKVFKNGIELVPAERANRGGHTVKLKQPKLKQILYPVYSPAEFERQERRRRLREYPPLIVIPAFKYNINITVAPFVITKLDNQVIVKFAITDRSPIVLTGRVPIKVMPRPKPRVNQAKAKFAMTQAGIERAQTQTNKLNKLFKLMKLWFMAAQLD